VRLAFCPAVGEGPESLLEAVVSDGERIYGTNRWPPEPGVYDGVDVLYTFTSALGQAQTFDFVESEGIGQLDAQWIGRAPGEHITFQAKFTVPNDGTGADVGFQIDAVIAPAMAPSVDSARPSTTRPTAAWPAARGGCMPRSSTSAWPVRSPGTPATPPPVGPGSTPPTPPSLRLRTGPPGHTPSARNRSRPAAQRRSLATPPDALECRQQGAMSVQRAGSTCSPRSKIRRSAAGTRAPSGSGATALARLRLPSSSGDAPKNGR